MKFPKYRKTFQLISNIKINGSTIHFSFDKDYECILDLNKNSFSHNRIWVGHSQRYEKLYFRYNVFNLGRTDKYGGAYYTVSFMGVPVRVHRLVAWLIYGEDIFGKEIDHIDRNRKNNNPENLRLVTSLENSKNMNFDYREHFKKVMIQSGRLMSKECVEEIRKLIKKGYNNTEISGIVEFKVDRSTVSRIRNGKAYKDTYK